MQDVKYNISWDISRALSQLTIYGGMYNESNGSSAIATIYVEENGRVTGRQSISIPIEVINRRTQDRFVRYRDGSVLPYSNHINIDPYVKGYSEDFADEPLHSPVKLFIVSIDMAMKMFRKYFRQ